ncbi:MAG: hypothetical protein PVJ57_14205 [Phycisphaerae bacterium]|jgi:hypothetical protein
MDERETSGLFISEIDRAGGDDSPQPTPPGAESSQPTPPSAHGPELSESTARPPHAPELPQSTARPSHAPESAERAPSPPHGPESAEPSNRRAGVADLLATIERVERVLGDLRSLVSSTVREKRQYEFSLARLFGSIAQALVAGLLLWAASDWIFGEPRDALLVKLAFATVLQMGALTGFLLGREVD